MIPREENKPKLLDQVRLTLRANHYSPKTKETGMVTRYHIHESTIQRAV